MRQTATIILLIFNLGLILAQDIDTFFLKHGVSKNDTIIYKRIIEFDKNSTIYHVKDYFENGQIQMDAFYSSFDKNIKEGSQCNYSSNTKVGTYKSWFADGQIECSATYNNGLINGLATFWYKDGTKESEEHWLQGQLHGKVKYWTEQGELQFDLSFDHGLNQNPEDVHYNYLSYTPKDYNSDTLKKWPLIIYLHGGSRRGTDLTKLYADGIPDQLYRGREFPFIIIAPQCPEHIRWSTDNWFENLYNEVNNKYRIDTNRIYLTGFSLGGSGTWFIAAKYPDKFAAIAPMSGFTSHMDYIDNNIEKLIDLPIWAFHGKIDIVVPFEETERIIKKLEGKNKNLRFSVEPEAGHWINWLVYPNQELYDWFLKYDKRSRINTGLPQSNLSGKPFLGEAPPGNTPKIFPLAVSPGFFAAERIAITNDGRDIYYSELKGYYPNTGESLKKYRFSDGKWNGPVTLFEGYAAPAFSVTGDTMYVETNFETYISVKNGSGWSQPKRILSELDSAHYFQVTGNGNYYISSKSGKGAGLSDWCSVKIKGSDTTVLSMGRPLNTSGENLDFFVSRDETFMIVTNRPGLGISYRNNDGTWKSPVNFGPAIDFGLASWGPYVTPDNKYLFYSTGTKWDYSDVHVYWVRIDGMIDNRK